MVSFRNGTGITAAADWARVRTSFTVAVEYSVFVGTTLCEFSDYMDVREIAT